MRTNEGDQAEIPDGDRLPVAEIRDPIGFCFTKPDLSAARFGCPEASSSLCGLDAEDLLQDALTRALEGRRIVRGAAPCSFRLSAVS